MYYRICTKINKISSIKIINHHSIHTNSTNYLKKRPITTMNNNLFLNVNEQRQIIYSIKKLFKNSTIHSSSSSMQTSMESLSNSSKNNFDPTKGIYSSKTTFELLRAWLVFSLCQFPYLVKSSSFLIKSMYSLLGSRLSNGLLKSTFFGHFCAGENLSEIRIVLNSLHKRGIGTILDYAAEQDAENPRDLNGIPSSMISARTFNYESERACDKNLEVSMQSIRDVTSTTNGFAAIKCTALGDPKLLVRMSSIIIESRRLFSAFDKPNLSGKTKALLDHWVDFQTFEEGLTSHFDKSRIVELFESIDKTSDGKIDYIEWMSFMNPIDLSMGPLTKYLNVKPLNEEEIKQLKNMIARLNTLSELAAETGVRLLIDAEQTYMQPAIDHLVLNLQRKYNIEKSVIFNTFQCYLKDSEDRLLIDLNRSQREGFRFACKLVRGAYMVQERKRAKDMGYQDPIHDSIVDTHNNFDALINLLLKNNSNASFMVASHNTESINKTTKWMKELNIPASEGGVFFGQLYGMCDRVSYSLGNKGYQVYKYVPYGPVEEVVPYLVRRAEENLAMIENAKEERKLVESELFHKLIS